MQLPIQIDLRLAPGCSSGTRAPKSPPRRLIHIPVIHTQADMGSLSPAIQAISIKKLGPEGWKRNLNLIDEIWAQIEQAISHWSLPLPKVRLYQDGLPVCGRELEIVTELAKAGSRNHQLLLRLKEQGATIMGTESPELLVREYNLDKEILEAHKSAKAVQLNERQKTLSVSLLRQRDEAIGARVSSTLRPGEIGLLFLGMLHAADPWIAGDIQIIHPVQLRSPGRIPCK